MLLAFAAGVLLPRVVSAASDLCPCLDAHPADLPRVSDTDDRLVFTPLGSGEQYYWPSDYGLGACEPHDATLPPYCNEEAPGWCEANWCYVDINACDEVVQRSSFFPGVADLYFSYHTCGNPSDFTGLTMDADFTKHLLNSAQAYISSTRRATEENYLTMDVDPAEPCPHSSYFCEACVDCETLAIFGGVRVNYYDVGFWLNQVQLFGETVTRGNAASCVASEIRGTFSKVISAQGDESRLGYQYFADQGTGSYLQAPLTDACPENDYDPRRRPWFAAGATGPKDLVIIVDVSGSMANTLAGGMARSEAAEQATLALLDTLNWADFFNIVLFGSSARRFSTNLMQATDANLASARTWISEQNFANGGTNFRDAFDSSFGTLRNSVADGTTSTCNRIFLFLSDGVPSAWEDSDYTWVAADADDLGVIIFTYGLGSGADSTTIKRIACENKGIYYNIDDNVAETALAASMTSYYEYFGAGQTKCSSSYLTFTDAFSSSQLYTGCLPLLNRRDSEPTLLGVSCLDLSMLVDWQDLVDSTEAFRELQCQMSAQTKQCIPLDLNECKREKLRDTATYAERCEDYTLPATCECVDPACEDDDDFVDELGYFCDSWVGDKCSEGIEDFGYSQSGMDAVFARCRRSCGECGTVSDSRCSESHCGIPEVPDTCRACRGIVPGVDILGWPMTCPSDPLPTSSTTSASGSSGDTSSGGGSSSDGGSMGAIIGGAIGALVVGGLVIAACFVCKAKRPPVVSAKVATHAAAVPPATVPATVPTTVAAVAKPAAKPRPAPPEGGGGAAPIGKVSTLPKAPMLPIPRLWINKDPSKAFVTTEPAADLIEVFQKLLDSTFTQITTRDRGGRPVPKALRVASVQRIENSELWQKYSNGRAAVTNKRTHRCTKLANLNGGMVKTLTDGSLKKAGIAEQLDDRVNEVYLFHGTTPSGALGIAQGGFNLNYAGSAAGSMYGPGVYMAEMSSKSDEYARDAEDGVYKGLCCLLLCRAVLGEILTLTAGGESVHPVVKAAMESGSYDSVLGDRQASVGTYREFVAYDDHQVYPEYLILYNRVAE